MKQLSNMVQVRTAGLVAAAIAFVILARPSVAVAFGFDTCVDDQLFEEVRTYVLSDVEALDGAEVGSEVERWPQEAIVSGTPTGCITTEVVRDVENSFCPEESRP